MRSFFCFAYLCITSLAVTGSFGALAYEGEWVFADAALLYGVWAALCFFKPDGAVTSMPRFKDEKQGKTFLWFVLSAFNLIGSVGYLIWYGWYLFAAALALLVALHVAEFFYWVTIPDNDDF